MAAISEGMIFGQISSKDTDLLGIEIANDEHNVIVTCKTKSIFLLNTAGKKIVYNWPVKHGNKISCPAVNLFKTSDYATVQNDKIIRIFSEGSTLDKCKRINAISPVYRILSVAGHGAVVVYQNGAVSSLGEEGTSGTASRGDLVFCTLTTSGENAYISTVHKKTVSAIEVVVRQKVGEKYAEKRTVTLERNDRSLLATCEQCQEKRTNLLFLWSDGCLQSLPIDEATDEARTLHHIPNITKNTCMISLDLTHIALSGLQSKDKENGVGIWDTKYGTLLSWQKYPEHSDSHQLYKYKNNVLLPCGRTIYQYQVDITPSTLSAALGKFSDSDDKPADVDIQLPKLSSWNLETKAGSTNKDSRDFSHIMTNMKNAAKAHDVKKFTDALKKFLNSVSKEKSARGVDEMNCAVQVWQYCIKGKNLWPSQQILELVKGHLVPSSMVDEICTAIIKRNDPIAIHTAIQSIHDIPESVLVKVLQYYLRVDENELSSVKSHVVISSQLKDSKEECPITLVKASLINAVLSQNYSDVFLVEYLRKMDFQNVLVLLKYLYFLLSGWKWSDKTALELTRFQVVDWINLLLDAHFTQLVISTDAHTMLVQLHELVSSQVSLHDELVSLDALLSQLKEQCTIPQKKGVGLYSIEVLHVF